MTTTRTLCPVVRDDTMRLFERVEIDRQYRYFPITKRILWVRESEAKIVLRHDGIDVDDRGTRNDWYGFLSSVTGAVQDEIPRLAAHYKIGVGDRLSVDLDVTLTDTPYLEDTSPEAREDSRRWGGQTYRKSYQCVPGYYNGGKWWYLTDEDVKGQQTPTLEAVKVFEGRAVYSTGKHLLGVLPPELAAWVKQEESAAVRKESPCTPS